MVDLFMFMKGTLLTLNNPFETGTFPIVNWHFSNDKIDILI